jgi:hypothetical protein
VNQNDDYETRADAEFDRVKEERPKCQCDTCLFINHLSTHLQGEGSFGGSWKVPAPESLLQRYRSNYDRIFGDK